MKKRMWPTPCKADGEGSGTFNNIKSFIKYYKKRKKEKRAFQFYLKVAVLFDNQGIELKDVIWEEDK